MPEYEVQTFPQSFLHASCGSLYFYTRFVLRTNAKKNATSWCPKHGKMSKKTIVLFSLMYKLQLLCSFISKYWQSIFPSYVGGLYPPPQVLTTYIFHPVLGRNISYQYWKGNIDCPYWGNNMSCQYWGKNISYQYSLYPPIPSADSLYFPSSSGSLYFYQNLNER